MKRKLFIPILSVILFVSLAAGTMEDDGKAGYTGSPGETTCNTSMCHNSFALNSGGGSISATSTMNNWTYEPFTTYAITVKVARTGNQLFGVGVELLTATNNNGGTLTISDPIHTHIKTRTVSSVSRRNVVHTLDGGASADSALFTFNWTSPDTSAGTMTLYMAGNATNANNQPTGDYVYAATQLIQPATGVGIDTPAELVPVSVFPNPLSELINLNFYLKQNENVSIQLYDLNGSYSFNLLNTELSSGQNNLSLPVPPSLRSGIYFLDIKIKTLKICRKIVVDKHE